MLSAKIYHAYPTFSKLRIKAHEKKANIMNNSFTDSHSEGLVIKVHQ